MIYTTQNFLDYADRILGFSEVQRIIQSGSHYDLVMCEIFLLDAFFAFGNKFNAPTIAMSPMKLIPHYNWIMCDPHPSSHFPALSLSMTEKMPLVSRIINLAYEFLFSTYNVCITMGLLLMKFSIFSHFFLIFNSGLLTLSFVR